MVLVKQRFDNGSCGKLEDLINSVFGDQNLDAPHPQLARLPPSELQSES